MRNFAGGGASAGACAKREYKSIHKFFIILISSCKFFLSLLILVDLIYALRISPRKVALQKETRKLVSESPRIDLEAILLLLGGGRADLRKALKPWHLKISQILSGHKQVMQWLDLGNSRPIPSQYQIMWHPRLT